MAMMIDPKSFRQQFEDASLDKIIKERDKIIRQIRKYEKGKIPQEEYLRCPSPDIEYYCNNLYLAELCYLINEKNKEEDEYY